MYKEYPFAAGKKLKFGQFKAIISRNTSYPLSILSYNHERNITIFGKKKMIHNLVEKQKTII